MGFGKTIDDRQNNPESMVEFIREIVYTVL